MKEKFNEEEAKKRLIQKEDREKEDRERERKELLAKTIHCLKKEFERSPVEVYIVGSILKPFDFSSRSDVDIVLKGYQGDRFTLWSKLEKELGRQVEIIPFETCHFQEFVLKEGLKVN